VFRSNPIKPVFFGLQTTDEMCVGVLAVTADAPGRALRLAAEDTGV
jgi:hypothetical protein